MQPQTIGDHSTSHPAPDTCTNRLSLEVHACAMPFAARPAPRIEIHQQALKGLQRAPYHAGRAGEEHLSAVVAFEDYPAIGRLLGFLKRPQREIFFAVRLRDEAADGALVLRDDLGVFW